jgi:hypothetical protein
MTGRAAFRAAAGLATALALAAALPAAAAPAVAPAATPAAARAVVPAAGPVCPADGPNAGSPPPVQIVLPGGGHLGACIDGATGQETAVVSTTASIFDFRDPAAPRPIWSDSADPNRYRVEVVAERGLRVTFETLLPRDRGQYAWAPFSTFDVGCDADVCRAAGARCLLDLPADEDRDVTAWVRQNAETGAKGSEAMQRLTDDLLTQALTGEERAGWLLDHLHDIFRYDQEGLDGLATARELVTKARGLGCPGFLAEGGGPGGASSSTEPGATGIRPPPNPGKGSRPSPPPTLTPQAIGMLSWLVGGRWEGQGHWTNGAQVRVENTYEWGPSHRTIHTTSWNIAGGARARLYDGLIFHDSKRDRVVLWNVRPAAGLGESEIVKAGNTGYEMADATSRSVVTRAGADGFTWSLRALQQGMWKETLVVTYKRRTR